MYAYFFIVLVDFFSELTWKIVEEYQINLINLTL